MTSKRFGLCALFIVHWQEFKMYSSVSRKWLIWLTKSGTYFAAIPFSWDRKQIKFISTNSDFRRWLFYFTVWLIYLIYFIVRMFLIISDKNTNYSVFIPFWKLFYALLSFVCLSIAHCHTGLTYKTLITFANDAIDFNYFLKGN